MALHAYLRSILSASLCISSFETLKKVRILKLGHWYFSWKACTSQYQKCRAAIKYRNESYQNWHKIIYKSYSKSTKFEQKDIWFLSLYILIFFCGEPRSFSEFTRLGMGLAYWRNRGIKVKILLFSDHAGFKIKSSAPQTVPEDCSTNDASWVLQHLEW